MIRRKVLAVKNPSIGTALLLIVGLVAFAQERPQDACIHTSRMRIYSNAHYVEEAGDVVGVELALTVHPDESVTALLYEYEGAPHKDGIPLPGRLIKETLAVEGTWIQHLRDSSGKNIVEKVPVKIQGTLDDAQFVGTIKIDGGSRETARLVRVDTIWLCPSKNATTERK